MRQPVKGCYSSSFLAGSSPDRVSRCLLDRSPHYVSAVYAWHAPRREGGEQNQRRLVPEPAKYMVAMCL
jgi:hypothetical protein